MTATLFACRGRATTYYLDTTLPLGVRSAPKVFTAVCDDLAKKDAECERDLATFHSVFDIGLEI